MFAPAIAQSQARDAETAARGVKRDCCTPPARLRRGGMPGDRRLPPPIGNQAVLRLLRKADRRQAPDGPSPLRIAPADDRLETEADRIAEQVMQGADGAAPAAAAPLQLSRKCATCEEATPSLHAKAASYGKPAAGEATAGLVQRALAVPGQPLEPPARDFFEMRFGRDLGGVRIHADAGAAAAARAVNALAYTVGRDIVFGAGQYAPATHRGGMLLAHELAHTLQQSNAAEGSGGAVIRRMVSKDYATIHSNLTYGLFDWAITDAEAHEVITILKGLNAGDLEDTVAAMEGEGLVDRLFDNVSYADRFAEADTLQRVQNARVQSVTTLEGGGTVSIVGSCKLDQQKAINDKIQSTKDWAKKSKDAVNQFVATPAAVPATARLLDRHFFHNTNNPPGLTEAQQTARAATIRDNFERVEQQASPLPNVCASPVDPACTTLAAAYVPPNRSAVMFCQVFFGYEAQLQTYMLLHELTHVYAGVRDRGYGNERIFAYLPPDSAIDNADSYALFATDIADGAGGSAAVRSGAPEDEFTDCSGPQIATIKHSFAFASRMITQALGALGETNPASRQFREVWLNTHFKTVLPGELERVIDRYQDVQKDFAEPIKFECEGSCDPGIFGYYRKVFGKTSHLCPPLLQEPNETIRQDELLTTVVMERLGINATAQPGTAAYAAQSKDQAYDNAFAYVAYARDVTARWGL